MREPDYLSKYRPNVGIVLFNPKGQIWLGRRVGTISVKTDGKAPYVWQMPQGGIDPDEDIIEAGQRELYEETGITTTRMLVVTPGWMVYDFPEGYRTKKKRRWHGQRQKWIGMLFEGDESEINLDAHGEKEFEDWRWAELSDTPSLIIPFKRGVYEELVKTFNPLTEYLRKNSRN